MYNNSNNDKDGEEEKKYTINDKKKNNGHQNPLPHRIRQGFKSGHWGIRVIAPLVSDFFVLLSR